jgi:hypothetical protein
MSQSTQDLSRSYGQGTKLKCFHRNNVKLNVGLVGVWALESFRIIYFGVVFWVPVKEINDIYDDSP